MSDTPNYKIWRPEYDGHAPPNWREGMSRNFFSISRDAWLAVSSYDKSWSKQHKYQIPVEALTAPNEDDAAFDVAVWLEQGRANLDKLPEGVVLPNPKDWATELWADLVKIRDPKWHWDLIRGDIEEDDEAAIALIRERVVLKGEG